MIAVWTKVVVAWFAILGLAIGNGLLRQRVLVPVWGEAPGTACSGLVLCALIVAATALAGRWMGPQPPSRLWRIGVAWVALTLVFEFGFGWLRRASWSEMLGAYTFEGGNLWPLVLVTTLVAPRMVVRRCRRNRGDTLAQPARPGGRRRPNELRPREAAWIARHARLLFAVAGAARSVDLSIRAGLDAYQATGGRDSTIYYFPTKYAMDLPGWRNDWVQWQGLMLLPPFAAHLEPLAESFQRAMTDACKARFAEREWVSATSRSSRVLADALEELLEAALAALR